MPMNIEDTTARVLEFVNDDFKRFEGVGYSDFKSTNPKKNTNLIQEKVYSIALKSLMQQHLEYQDGLKTNLKSYIRFLGKEVKVVERSRSSHKGQTPGDSSGKRTIRTPKGDRYNKEKYKYPDGGLIAGSTRKTEGGSQPGKFVPLCLNEEHKKKGIRHHMPDCDITSKKECDRLVEQYQADKRKESKRVTFNTSHDVVNFLSHDKSTDINVGALVVAVITAVFAESESRVVCADGGRIYILCLQSYLRP